MRSNSIKYLSLIFFMLLTVWALSCSGRSGKIKEDKGGPAAEVNADDELRLITMKSPEENSTFRSGNPVNVILTPANQGTEPDSVLIHYDGKAVVTLKQSPWEYSIPGSFTRSTGRRSLKAVAYRGGRSRTTIARFMIILSDIRPEQYSYKVVNEYPHDRAAFTQGLFYDNGLLYEGTGQETGSTLREVELRTGKVLRQLNLSQDLFGEGITLFKDRIYQVTWRSKVGFVYEKSTFNLINKIYYQSEGWGLTTMEDHIVMSEGTNVLYIIEPEMFTVVSRLEVYNNEKMVDQLNELEYINGEIWANIWYTDLIARIDPSTGKLIGYIDLKGILKDPGTDTSINVLNGIAFDKETGRIFVTGKNWPRLFEIRVVK